MTQEFYNLMLRAKVSMLHWNDCHPCGGSEISRELERNLSKFMDENPIKNTTLYKGEDDNE